MKTLVCSVISLLLVACSAGPAPVSNSPHDPSNPAAPEGAPAPGAGGVTPGADGHGHSHGAPAGSAGGQQVVYACPMHPEVVSNAPGNCPKCGMNLVPRQ